MSNMKKASAENQKEQIKTIEPLTLDEMHEAAKARIDFITKEFSDGFALLEKYPKSVTFFGSARVEESHPLYEQARNLGNRIAKDLGYAVVTGGGPGVMEAVSRGAFEVGGKTAGLNIKLPMEQQPNKFLTDTVEFYYFFIRKVCLSFSAEAYVFFPGGFGTYDELFEILTLVQTNKIKRVPIILVGEKSYWKRFDAFVRKMLRKYHFIDESDRELYTITNDEDEIIRIIKEAPVRNGLRFDPNQEFDSAKAE